jgi:cell division protein FtsB
MAKQINYPRMIMAHMAAMARIGELEYEVSRLEMRIASLEAENKSLEAEKKALERENTLLSLIGNNHQSK